ncbi:DUF2690 domain-containing protein [Streptomyces harbinensis]|uniref:DUF2690 domain-containing protein n=1 Tax=Streptomyces harbinensis TaxID=1176198 RepID=UPI001587853E
MKQFLSAGSRFAAALAAFGFAAIFSLTASGTAQAAPSHHGQFPVASGCSSDARTLNSARMRTTGGQDFGYIEMRYSPSCGTQWIRVTSTLTNCSGHPCLNETTIRRPAGPDGPAATFRDSGVPNAGATAQWGRMVYTPNTRSCGTGVIDIGPRFAYPGGVPGAEICG